MRTLYFMQSSLYITLISSSIEALKSSSVLSDSLYPLKALKYLIASILKFSANLSFSSLRMFLSNLGFSTGSSGSSITSTSLASGSCSCSTDSVFTSLDATSDAHLPLRKSPIFFSAISVSGILGSSVL